MTLRIGLTGGIGSGKTTVAHIFEVLGIPVYYADTAAKRIMNEDAVLKQKLLDKFGENVYRNNMLDRQWLAAEIFNSPEKLALLNSLVHPATIADASIWMKRQTSPYAIKEAALIFESGAEKQLDYVIGVSAPLNLRIQRAMQRENSTKEAVMARAEKQMNETEKMNRCDFVLINDEKELLLPQVIALHEKLLSLA
ncbi:MAG: dephospho-CoA kinase [Ferruginibacter sp.]